MSASGSFFRDGLHGVYQTQPRDWHDSFSCNCIGPRNGEPRCRCQMRNVIERDGRWILLEQDLGPVRRYDGPALAGTLADANSKAPLP